MKWTLELIAVLIIVLILVACGVESVPVGDPALGEELYTTKLEEQAMQRSCSDCHSLDGSETYSPTFQGIGERASERVTGMSAEEYLRESIVDPKAYMLEGYTSLGGIRMPTVYGEILTEEDINNLIAFLLTQ